MVKSLSRWQSALALSGSLLVVGCGDLIKDRSGDYLKSEEIPPLSLPADVDDAATGQIYGIPAISNTTVEIDGQSVPRPRPLSETRFEEVVKIQSHDGVRWILINRPPEEVWPRVRNILGRNGVPTVSADAAAGLMETSWVQFKDDDKNSHRFRLSIEPAVQVESTEVQMLHTQAALGAEPDLPEWPESSQDELREKQMLEIVANMMASDISSGSVSLLAQSIGGEAKVEMVTPQVADPYLVIKLNFERSWASVLYSLSRGGFSITDQNKTAGVVYVDYIEPGQDEETGGFFSGWFGDDEGEPAKTPYQVLIKSVDQGVEVRIADEDRQSLGSALSTDLLTAIRNNLT